MIAVSSKAQRFRDLAAYLVAGRSGREEDRVAWTSARNLPTSDPELAGKLMRATAEQNARVQRPVYHLVVSFDVRDAVDCATMERVADRVLERLGLTEHEAVIVAHRDREHAHMHLMVNRVHPESAHAWELSYDYRAIQEVLREEERALGIREVAGRWSGRRAEEIDHAERHPRERAKEAKRALELPLEVPSARTGDTVAHRDVTPPMRLDIGGAGLVPSWPLDDRNGGSGGVSELAQKLRTYEQVVALFGEEYAATNTLSAARARFAHLEAAEARATVATQNFERALARVYTNPEAARAAFGVAALESGIDAAARVLREQPERFGPLIAVKRTRTFALVRTSDDRAARGAALAAATLAREAWYASVGMETPRAIAEVRKQVAGAEKRHDEARSARGHLPEQGILEREIGRAMRQLLPREVEELRRMVTDPQFAIATRFRRALREAVLDRDGREW